MINVNSDFSNECFLKAQGKADFYLSLINNAYAGYFSLAPQFLINYKVVYLNFDYINNIFLGRINLLSRLALIFGYQPLRLNKKLFTLLLDFKIKKFNIILKNFRIPITIN